MLENDCQNAMNKTNQFLSFWMSLQYLISYFLVYIVIIFHLEPHSEFFF